MAVIRVHEVLGEDTHGPATIGSIRLNKRPDGKVILSIDDNNANTLASAILTLVQSSELLYNLEMHWMDTIIRRIEDDEEE